MKARAFSQRIELKNRTNGSRDEGGLDEYDSVGLGESGSTGNDDGRRDAQPTIMATTCCKAKGRASKKWGMPSMTKSEALRVFEIGSFSTMVHLL